MSKKKSKIKVCKYVFGTVFLFLANLIHWATSWALNEFGALDFNTLVFHLNADLEGTNVTPFVKPALICIGISIGFTLVGLLLVKLCNTAKVMVLTIHKAEVRFPFDFWKRYYVFVSLALFVVSLTFNLSQLGLIKYIKGLMFPTQIFEEEYIPPQDVVVEFPEEKRNLIYIFLETMENSYASIEYGGTQTKNLIPGMTELQLENINFSISDTRLNGAGITIGACHTSAAIIAQTAGVPVYGGEYYIEGKVLPGAYSIGQILEKEGYNQIFLLGSNGNFSCRAPYMIQHGNYEIHDYYYAIEQGWIPEDYRVFWGYEDKKLYEYAKNELLNLSQKEEPFNLTMLTVDTHFSDGYLCELCENTYEDNQYSNVISCADRQLTEFVNWVQEQDFYENTTIVICGDHTQEYGTTEKTVYTTVINSAIPFTGEKTRLYTSFDLYPTTLASLGAKIDGERLGLGTNLFSGEDTLVEKYGLEYLNEELSKTSRYYHKNIFYGTK